MSRQVPGITLTQLGPSGAAAAINEHGDIVGMLVDGTGNAHATLWTNARETELVALEPGIGSSEAIAINARKLIVGKASVGAATHAVLWKHGKIVDLGSLGGSRGTAHGINFAGQIVGESNTTDGLQHAFLWERGVMTDLGTILPDRRSGANGINALGQIVGYSLGVSQPLGAYAYQRAVLWEDGRITALGELPGYLFGSVANAINDDGLIVGWSSGVRLSEGYVHAVLWDHGAIVDLGTLGGRNSQATAIDSRGRVVGTSDTATGESHGFLWENGVMTDLGKLTGAAGSRALGINAKGQVVGASGYSPVMWSIK
jgi:probable HAF family extracellular repeat protein